MKTLPRIIAGIIVTVLLAAAVGAAGREEGEGGGRCDRTREGPVKRAGGLMERIACFENLVQAWRLASRGKKGRPSTARFGRDLERELLRLERALREGNWRPGKAHRFVTRDTKERRITVPPFRERVAHHAILNRAAPVLESRFDHDSYGCRKGKGMDKALDRAQRFCGRYAWCLKITGSDLRDLHPPKPAAAGT